MAANKNLEQKTPVRGAAVDVGNNAGKPVIGGYLSLCDPIPNVIAEAEFSRDILEYEKTTLDGLHVQITSTALSGGQFVGYVGALAAKESHKTELVQNTKSESDQTIIILLTSLALDAVECGKFEADENNTYNTRYLPSTGVPIMEAKKAGAKKIFKDRLVNGVHSVKFLQTPKHEGKTVNIDIFDAVINNEGQAAMIDLTTNPDGSAKNPELADMDIMVFDIGGLSSDKAILTTEGIDNRNSKGEEVGADTTLDEIIEEVASTIGYHIRSRRECLNIITHKISAERYNVYLNGKPVSIKEIADKHLNRLAVQEYQSIALGWQAVPSLRRGYIIGGGALLLKQYIEKINAAKQNLPLYFLEDDIEITIKGENRKFKKSVWIIAQSYWILLQMYANAKGYELMEG